MSIRLGLERLSKYFTNSNSLRVFPDSILPNTIHVGGTNGKGSICKLIQDITLESYLARKEDIKIGKFSSPYTVAPNDAITINNKAIPLAEYNKRINIDYKMKADEQLTLFEEATIKSIEYFKKMKTDLNIMEVGCGGLLDSTNIIPASDKLLIIINKISLDHTDLLGETLKHIAEQKAGIISGKNEKCRVLINSENDKEQVLDTIVAKCQQMGMNYQLVDTSDSRKLNNEALSDFLEKNFKHNYQYGNIIMAVNGLRHLEKIKKINPVATESIVATLKKFQILGRLTKLDFPIGSNNSLPLFIDGSHNNDALENLGKYIDYHFRNGYSDQMVFVISKTSSKSLNWSNIIRKNDIVIITEFKDVKEMGWIKSAPASSIYEELALEGVPLKNIIIEEDIKVAITIANINSKSIFNSKNPKFKVVVVGSLYLAGKVLSLYEERTKHNYIKQQ